jgi:hypothetical protein
MEDQQANGHRRTLYGVAIVVGLVIGALAVGMGANANSGSTDETTGPVVQFIPQNARPEDVTIPIDHVGSYTWKSDAVYGSAAAGAAAYVVEPRYLNAVVENAAIDVFTTSDGGTQLVFTFSVTSFKEGASAIVLAAHGDDTLPGGGASS